MAGVYMEDLRAAIEGRWNTEWDESDAPTQWANVPFRTPENDPWVSLELIPGAGGQITCGDTSIHRWAGVIQVSIHGPIGEGTNDVFELADTAADVFRGQNITTSSGVLIRIRAPVVRVHGVVSGWTITTVEFPMTWEITMSRTGG